MKTASALPSSNTWKWESYNFVEIPELFEKKSHTV